MSVRLTEVDGVPVVWRQGPDPLTALLTFRVGLADETFVTGGITHLVEHLAMSTLKRSPLDKNAFVDTTFTTFVATGRPAAVVEFLEAICRALGELPVDRIPTELRVLEAESGGRPTESLATCLAMRYGATGPGLRNLPTPALPDLTTGEVLGHAARYFTRDNAVLGLTGPPPEGLRLPLPAGRREPLPPLHVAPKQLPAWDIHDEPFVGLSVEAPRTDALRFATPLLADRLEERLRHRGGHSYDVGSNGVLVAPGVVHVAFFADVVPGNGLTVANELLDTVRGFAETGPTEEEIGHVLADLQEYVEDPRAAVDHVAGAAERLLVTDGEVFDPAADLVAFGKLRPAELAAAVADALPTALLAVPDPNTDVEFSGLVRADYESGPPATGRRYLPRPFTDLPRRARLVVGDGAVTVFHAWGSVTLRATELVGAEVGDGGVYLFGRNGNAFPVRARDWFGGSRAVRDVLAWVPADVRFPRG